MLLSLENISVLQKLAEGIIPSDSRDGGAEEVFAGLRIAERVHGGINSEVYRNGLELAQKISVQHFQKPIAMLSSNELEKLLGLVQETNLPFFKQLRLDVTAIYLSDPRVWQRIGFPGPSAASGGYPDFDQPQKVRAENLKQNFMTNINPAPEVISFLSSPRKMLIGSKWTESASGEWIDAIDPATGQTIGKFPSGNATDVDAAVKAARAAFKGSWKKITPYERGRLLQRVAGLIEKHGEELAQLITIENGKPLWEAQKEVATAVSWTEYYAGWTTKLLGDTIPVSLPGQFLNYTIREPLGVVAGITPPNYPLTMPLYKAAPALATGNTIILILIRFQVETNTGRILAWQDHVGLIHSS